MRRLGGLLASAAMLAVAGTGGASAAGFQRGIADTDILYEPGMFSARFGLTYVSPERGFSSIEGVSGDYGQYTGSYRLPSPAIKFGNGPFACAGTYIESFAAEANYSNLPGGAQPASDTGSAVRDLGFDSNEWGLTCRASYEADIGRFSLLGGVFFEDFNFEGTSLGSTPTGATLPNGLPVRLPISLSVDARSDYQTGYRIGIAYEKPEIALRAQILYRSEVEHDRPEGTGIATVSGPAFVINPLTGATIQLPSSPLIPAPGTAITSGEAFLNKVTSPQSLYVNFQTGIAEDTLLLASFRWTDWSTNRNVLTSYVSPRGTSQNDSPYYWDDGYTVQVGLGRAITDEISAAVMLGYDSGVSTGAETTYTDLYTVSGGVSFKQNFGEIRVGGLVGYWTDGSQSVDRGAIFNAEVGDDWVYAATASFKLNF